MTILDLFCKEGGAAMGLHQAWPEAEIYGVDIKRQRRYPFHFIHADAIEYLDSYDRMNPFDFIWASPPCQKFSMGTHWIRGKQAAKEHPDFIAPVRDRLKKGKTPWVIENVPAAPLLNPVTLCGSMFGLSCAKGYLRRHRIFETSFPVVQPKCNHNGRAVSVSGHGAGGMFGYRKATADEARELLQVPWMSREGAREAVPPAYSEYIARQFGERRAEEREG